MGGPRRGGANRVFQIELLSVIHPSQVMQAKSDTPRCVCDLMYQGESERVLCFCTFCANSWKSPLCLSHRQNQRWSLTRDTRLHETTLGRDINYHTEGTLNKMNSWITNISCLFVFFSTSVLPGVLTMKAEETEHRSSREKKKKKNSENDNQIAAAMTVWLVWYSALITENAEFIIYTFHSFLCSYGLRYIELWELCN